jgi:hypothetical protein
MTSGTRTRPRPSRADARRRLLGALLGSALALAARGAGASGFDLTALMALLARRRSGEARFTEERTVAALDAPLRASGRLSFQAPDRFARHTEQPRPESMEVLGNTVVLRRGTRTRQLTLDTVPELAALADALRGTLTGNAEVLQRHFDAQVAGSAERWTLTLTPRSAQLRGSIVGIEILGLRADVRSIDMALTGGDRSLMLIEPLKAAAP